MRFYEILIAGIRFWASNVRNGRDGVNAFSASRSDVEWSRAEARLTLLKRQSASFRDGAMRVSKAGSLARFVWVAGARASSLLAGSAQPLAVAWRVTGQAVGQARSTDGQR